MLDAAVDMFGPDMEPVTKSLTDLGARHVEYGVLPAHYGIVGEALLFTLETALGDSWTPKIKQGWTDIYGFISTAMMAGADRQLRRKLKRSEARDKKLAAKKQSSSATKPTADKLIEKQKTSYKSKPRPATIMAQLFEITGIKGPGERTFAKQKGVSRMIDDALNISTHSEEALSVQSDVTGMTEPLDGILYSRMVESVYISWDKVKKIPNYQEVAGVLLFGK
jgi:hypothetical protein